MHKPLRTEPEHDHDTNLVVGGANVGLGENTIRLHWSVPPAGGPVVIFVVAWTTSVPFRKTNRYSAGCLITELSGPKIPAVRTIGTRRTGFITMLTIDSSGKRVVKSWETRRTE